MNPFDFTFNTTADTLDLRCRVRAVDAFVRSVGWLVGKIKSNIPRAPLPLYPLPAPSSTLCFTPRSYPELAKNHVSADDESVVLLQRMSTPSGFPVITQTSYPQAKNFTIKEVPIPEVKDDEVLLKGIVLPFRSGGS